MSDERDPGSGLECICGELLAEWMRTGIDRETFNVEIDQQFLYGHYASCPCWPPQPRGLFNFDETESA